MHANLHIMQAHVNSQFAYHALEPFCVECKNGYVQIHLKQLRERLGKTLEQLAEDSDFSYSMLSRWESGRSNIPSGNLPGIAKTYRCRVQDIFSSDGPPPIFMPNEDKLTELLRGVQQELPERLPAGEWPQSAASALRRRLEQLAGDPATHANRGQNKKAVPLKDAPPRPPTKRAARA